MQQSNIPGSSRVFQLRKMNENRENNLQEFSQCEQASYRRTERVDRTMTTSQT